jgi:hypothetical protein
VGTKGQMVNRSKIFDSQSRVAPELVRQPLPNAQDDDEPLTIIVTIKTKSIRKDYVEFTKKTSSFVEGHREAESRGGKAVKKPKNGKRTSTDRRSYSEHVVSVLIDSID